METSNEQTDTERTTPPDTEHDLHRLADDGGPEPDHAQGIEDVDGRAQCIAETGTWLDPENGRHYTALAHYQNKDGSVNLVVFMSTGNHHINNIRRGDGPGEFQD